MLDCFMVGSPDTELDLIVALTLHLSGLVTG
jgi:hypothetical protein